MAKFNLITSTGTTVTTDTTTAGGGALLTIFDETGAGTALATINVSGYEVQAEGAGVLPAGTGTADVFLANATNDVIIWDSALITNTTFGGPAGDRHRLNTANGTVAYERFDLGDGNDVINLTRSAAGVGTPGIYALNSTIFGNAGNDVIASGAGDDRLLGDGNALGSIPPTPGRDTLFGGAGHDAIYGDNGSFSADATIGDADTLYGGSGNDTMFGEGGDDRLFDTVGTNTFYGGGGNDIVNAHNPDLAYGGLGDDRIFTAALAYGGEGNDTIDHSAGSSGRLFGDAGSDTILGSVFDDTLYGGFGNDTVFGGKSADTLYGEIGTDSLFGGISSDVIYAGADLVTVTDTTVVGWDGNSSTGVEITVAAGSNYNNDRIDGGADDPFLPDAEIGVQDILVMDMDPGAPRNVLQYTATGSSAVLLSNVEAIVATLGADLINLTYISGGTQLAYDGSVLINANYGDDIVFSGSGNDTIVGDSFFAFGLHLPGNDMLFGGSGDDILYGDLVSDGAASADPGGNDTLVGGFGFDTIYGGGGDDTISDSDGADVYGGLGADIFSLHYVNRGEVNVDTGPDVEFAGGTDGDDIVTAYGMYDRINGSLGAGNDVYISSFIYETNGETTPGWSDLVYGGTGNDVVATYYGDDTLYGGAGGDILWGGVNNNGDYLYGGDSDDTLYIGNSGEYFAYGGAGSDYVYWELYGGNSNVQFYDSNRLGEAGDGTLNYLIIFGEFDTEEMSSDDEPIPDFLRNGSGVFQTSHDLEHPGTIEFPPNEENPEGSSYSDGLQLTDNGDGTWTLMTIYTGSSITFDPNDISTIVLWNNDAVNPNDPNVGYGIYDAGQPVQTFYHWNGITYEYSPVPV